MTPRLRDTSGGPVHQFCHANVLTAAHPGLRDTSGGPVHQFCHANVTVGAAA